VTLFDSLKLDCCLKTRKVGFEARSYYNEVFETVEMQIEAVASFSKGGVDVVIDCSPRFLSIRLHTNTFEFSPSLQGI
jgi:hypothetical protein